MDGHFVPPITIGALIVDALRDLVHERGGVLDVHLMIERPERRVEEFAAAGADTLIVHWEATPHVHYALQAVRAAGLDAGLALNPATPPEVVAGLTDEIDHVLCMTVNPGWGGQPYIASSTAKVARLRELLGPEHSDRGGRRDRRLHGGGHARGRGHAVRGGLLDLRLGRPRGGLHGDRDGRRRGLGSRRDRPDQVHAHRGPDPDALGEPPPGPSRRAAAAAQSGHDGARRARRPHADLPDGDHRPGGLDGPRGRDPRAGARRLPALAPHAAVPGAPARARARYAGPHLLQVRGRLPGRLAQAEQRRGAGVREQAGRREAPGHGDRRRPVGLGARDGVRPVRARVRGLHGRRELRPEALPARDDGELGRHRDPLSERHHRGRQEPGLAPHRLARDRDLRGGGGGRGRPRARTTRSARSSTTSACTRP